MTHFPFILIPKIAFFNQVIIRHENIRITSFSLDPPVDDNHFRCDFFAIDLSNIIADESGPSPGVSIKSVLDEGRVVDLSILPSGVCPPVVTENGISNARILESNSSANFAIISPFAFFEL